MMIDVRQNMRAAAEPPSNLRVEKYYGVYNSLCLCIKHYTEMAKFFTNTRSAGNLEIIFTESAKKCKWWNVK